MKGLVCILFILSIMIAGCTMTQKGAGVGTALGAGTGAIIGHQSGHTAEGALIGGAAGAAAGALIGDTQATKFCPVCGESFPADVKYCPKCGSELKFKQK